MIDVVEFSSTQLYNYCQTYADRYITEMSVTFGS